MRKGFYSGFSSTEPSTQGSMITKSIALSRFCNSLVGVNVFYAMDRTLTQQQQDSGAVEPTDG